MNSKQFGSILLVILFHFLIAGAENKVGVKVGHTLRLIDSLKASGKVDNHLAWDQFGNFVRKFNRAYGTEAEVLKRFQIYTDNQGHVKLLQAHDAGTAVYGETKFMDMSRSEFESKYLSNKMDADKFVPTKNIKIRDEPVQESFDWRDHKVITEVKDQGQCGSCWAFSTTGNIEAMWALETNQLISLSEQQLLDCDNVDQACNGGLMTQAYDEIIRMGGLVSEEDYPYQTKQDTCQLNEKKIAAYINDSMVLPKDEGKMASWLADNGPISIGINALPLQFYKGGIFHPWKIFCLPFMINHGVLAVGYGEEDSKPFWSVKNSWGQDWGEDGYFRIYRGKNVCGINKMASSAIVEM